MSQYTDEVKYPGYNWSDDNDNSYGGSGGSSGMRNDPVLRQYQDMISRRQQQAARQKQIGIARLADLEKNSLTQAYVKNQQQQQALPQQIALSGGGGVSESAQIGLNAAYGQGRNDINTARMAQENDLVQNIDNGLNSDIAGLQSALMARYAQMEQNRLNQARQEKEDAWRQEQFDYQKQQDEYAKKQAELAKANAYALQQQKLQASLAKANKGSGSNSSNSSNSGAIGTQTVPQFLAASGNTQDVASQSSPVKRPYNFIGPLPFNEQKEVPVWGKTDAMNLDTSLGLGASKPNKQSKIASFINRNGTKGMNATMLQNALDRAVRNGELSPDEAYEAATALGYEVN